MSRMDEIASMYTAEELYEFGKEYRDGNAEKGFPLNIPDPERAIKYFKKAAEKGHIEAGFALGCMYEKIGGEKYIEKAADYYNLAANHGHRAAKEALDRLTGKYPALMKEWLYKD